MPLDKPQTIYGPYVHRQRALHTQVVVGQMTVMKAVFSGPSSIISNNKQQNQAVYQQDAQKMVSADVFPSLSHRRPTHPLA